MRSYSAGLISHRVADVKQATYEELADEYYNSILHPTCHNFRIGSLALIESFMKSVDHVQKVLCEVGAGRTFLCDTKSKYKFREVVLVDKSAAMLEHSMPELGKRARYLHADASSIPLADCYVDILVSSLGDPYNRAEFWQESYRLLKVGGHMIFTTPSIEWAHSFRHIGEQDRAEFYTRDKRVLSVESYIRPHRQQRELMIGVGLTIIDSQEYGLHDLRSAHISPKLSHGHKSDYPIVTGYLLRKNPK